MSARRSWAWPLVPLYAAGLAVKDGLRRLGIPRTRRLNWPVVSVGSLSAGGAGKTPVVIGLARLLSERGWVVDVLSRGYRRRGSRVERVDPQAEAAAARFGDEPVLIAQRTGVSVWVDDKRYAAGQTAEAASDPQTRGVHLLDDGFQHHELVRAVDVVLVTAEDLDDALLPAGNRREPWRALRRAAVVVLREEERERVLPRVSSLLRYGAAVWSVRRTVELPESVLGPDRRLVAFCGIARPGDFIQSLKTTGLNIVDSVAFPDHHRYTTVDMHRLTAALRASSGETFVTTEKDAVKIDSGMRALLEAVTPLLVARLRVEFVNVDAVIRELEGRIS